MQELFQQMLQQTGATGLSLRRVVAILKQVGAKGVFSAEATELFVRHELERFLRRIAAQDLFGGWAPDEPITLHLSENCEMSLLPIHRASSNADKQGLQLMPDAAAVVAARLLHQTNLSGIIVLEMCTSSAIASLASTIGSENSSVSATCACDSKCSRADGAIVLHAEPIGAKLAQADCEWLDVSECLSIACIDWRQFSTVTQQGCAALLPIGCLELGRNASDCSQCNMLVGVSILNEDLIELLISTFDELLIKPDDSCSCALIIEACSNADAMSAMRRFVTELQLQALKVVESTITACACLDKYHRTSTDCPCPVEVVVVLVCKAAAVSIDSSFSRLLMTLQSLS